MWGCEQVSIGTNEQDKNLALHFQQWYKIVSARQSLYKAYHFLDQHNKPLELSVQLSRKELYTDN